MGWWSESGMTIGDGPADRVAAVVAEAGERLSLAAALAGFQAALRRNAAAYVGDPEALASAVVARARDGRSCPAEGIPADSLADAFQDAIEASAMEYRESELERLPTTAELLETLAFVLRPLVPGPVAAPPGFELHHIGVEAGAGTEADWARPSQRIVLPQSLSWQRVESAVLALGLVRDADAAPQPEPPHFASWTRQPGLDLEIDWHAPPQQPRWLEVRGDEAGEAAATLAGALGGRRAPTEAEALAELLTVPPSAANAGNSAARWELLAVLVRSPAADRGLAEPLIAAGLRDPDWRVRMTAVWGVGALRIGPLAAAAASAPLPDAAYEGLNGDDRRTLLALRDAARDRAAGSSPAPPDREGGGPGGAGRAAFVGRVGALFDRLAPPPGDRHEALLMALLRMPGIARDRTAGAWHAWMA
jgi:HEAT repeat